MSKLKLWYNRHLKIVYHAILGHYCNSILHGVLCSVIASRFKISDFLSFVLSEGIDFKKSYSTLPKDRRYSQSMLLCLFIGQLDGKMDGNHSQLDVVSHLICEDVQPPLIINIVLGLPANMCVMWLILAGPGDKAADIFSLNQAVCEVAICMSNAMLLIAVQTKGSNIAINTFIWYTVRFSSGFIFSGRPLFMTCICLERYLAVVHPVTFLKYKLLRYRLAGTFICWLTVLVCCLILVWVPYSATYYVSFGMAFTWFLVQLFCCVETLRALLRPGPGEGNQESNGMNSAKLKAFRIITIIIVTATLAYLLYTIAIISLGHIPTGDSATLFCIAAYITLVAGFVQPFLYIHRAGKLQRCIKGAV